MEETDSQAGPTGVKQTMRAVSLQDLNKVECVELPVPVPAPDEILVRTVATTICTSDLIDIASNPFDGPLPRVLGHEGAGVVAALGAAVRGFHIGQPVATHPVIPCRECDCCRRGLGHLCQDMGHLGLNRDGTFAEYFRIRSDRAWPTPESFDLALAALLEPVAVCLQAVHRARIGDEETALIVGDGPFGVLIARLAGRHAKRVVLLGRHDFRMRFAPDAVAIKNQRHGENRREDSLRRISEAVEGQGVDAAILCVGSAEAADLAMASLRQRGRLVVFSGIDQPAPVDLFTLHIHEKEILGACNDEDRHDEALALLSDNDLALKELITHRLPFSQWREALEFARSGKEEAMKVAIVFD